MTDIDDQIVHLRTTEQPTAEEMAAAPILDNWVIAKPFETIEREYNAHGTVSGSRKFPDEHRIGTSAIASADYADRWVRTKNTLYRLGWQHQKALPAVFAAMQPDWVTAWTAVRDGTGQHTLRDWAWAAATAVGGSPDIGWPARRSAATCVGDDLYRSGRPSVARAWWLLGTDASDKYAVGNIAESLTTEIGSDISPETSIIVDGWQALADGKTDGGDLSDSIAAARRIGEWHQAKPQTPLPPLLLRMAQAPNSLTAAKLLIAEMEVTEIVAANVTTQELASGNGDVRQRSAQTAFDFRRAVGFNDHVQVCLRLLMLDPTDRIGCNVIRSKIEQHLRETGVDPETDRLAIAWNVLAAGLTPPAHPKDAIMSAWAKDTAKEIGIFSGTDAYRELKIDVDAPVAEGKSGVVVLAKVGGTQESQTAKECIREFKDIVGKRLPIVPAPDMVRVRATLRDEFPHAHAQIDVLLSGLVEGEPVRMRPAVLLVGPAGGGKSRLAVRISECLCVGLHRFDGAGASDNAFGGTPRRWSSGEHCQPLEAVRRHKIANPMMLVDEIDKAGTSRHNGSLENALMPFLGGDTTSSAYPDPYVQSECCLSHVNFLLTANDDTVLSGPLRDRLRIVRMPGPTIEHMVQIVRTMVADIARERGGDRRWFPDFDDDELCITSQLWRGGGSVRRLRAIVERMLAYREQKPRN